MWQQTAYIQQAVMAGRVTLVYFSYLVAGFLLSLLFQKVTYDDVISVLDWIKCKYTNITVAREKVLPLLTLVVEKKKFKVAVLPPTEVQESGMVFFFLDQKEFMYKVTEGVGWMLVLLVSIPNDQKRSEWRYGVFLLVKC